MEAVATRLAEIRERAGAAAHRSGRESGDLEDMVVSKMFPVDVVQEAVDAGHALFGENKVQEAAGKIPCLPEGLRWH